MNQMEDWFEHIYYSDINSIDSTYKYLAEGSSRLIYAISDDLIVKIATCRDGVRQCRTESRVYRHCGSYLRRYLSPVLYHRHGMIVMARAVPLVNNEYVTGDPPVNLSQVGPPEVVAKDLRTLSKKFDLLYEDLISATSWGHVKDRLVLIDYGCEN